MFYNIIDVSPNYQNQSENDSIPLCSDFRTFLLHNMTSENKCCINESVGQMIREKIILSMRGNSGWFPSEKGAILNRQDLFGIREN